jgi:hypothetical protein
VLGTHLNCLSNKKISQTSLVLGTHLKTNVKCHAMPCAWDPFDFDMNIEFVCAECSVSSSSISSSRSSSSSSSIPPHPMQKIFLKHALCLGPI